MNGPDTPRWETLAASVQGSNKRCNQDWYLAEGTGGAGDPLILAVADGHGSAAHSRSEWGAQFAVRRFASVAREFAGLARNNGPEGRPSLQRLMHHARERMPRMIVSAWRQEVLDHWSRHPDRGAPSDGLGPVSDAPGHREPSDSQKALLYGTTLIGAVLTPQLFAAWQLGDGELAVVEHDGSTVLPLAPVEADFGDETESLCSREAWRMIRVHWAPLTAADRMPRLISLSTDGLSKSFVSDEGFRQFATGLGERLASAGCAEVRSVLPSWLAEASRFSGDDTTLAAAFRADPGSTDVPDARDTADAPGVPDATTGRPPPVAPADPHPASSPTTATTADGTTEA